MLKSKLFQTAIGFLISAGLIIWICSTINWEELKREFTKINYALLIPCVFVMFAHFFLRAYRWRYLINDGRKIKFLSLFDSLMLGNFATYILPLRAGEFIRPFFLARKEGITFSSAFVSVVIERFFDLSFVLLSFGLMVVYIPGIPDLAYQGAKALGVLSILILLVMTLGMFAPRFLLNTAEFFLKFLPVKIATALNKFLQDFLAGTKVLVQKGNVFYVIFYSMLVWGSAYLTTYLWLDLCGSHSSFLVASAITVIIALAIAAPSAPGFIGVYQAGCIAAFALFGMSKESAVVFSVVSHALNFLSFIGYGVFILFKENLSLGDLKQQNAKEY